MQLVRAFVPVSAAPDHQYSICHSFKGDNSQFTDWSGEGVIHGVLVGTRKSAGKN